jgi:hypothetical protein
VKNQVGITEPTRDWFPLSLMGAFADFADSCTVLKRGMGPGFMRLPPELRRRHGRDDRQRNEGDGGRFRQFLNIPGLVKDMQKITDAAAANGSRTS